MSRIYKKPPLVEAVCEFVLAPGSGWDLTTPGLLYEGLKGDYPIKEPHSGNELRLAETPGGLGQELMPIQRMRFVSPDRRALVQAGFSESLLSVHCFAPYPGWELFRPRISQAFDLMCAAIGTYDLERIGLRYINRIAVPETDLELQRYFRFYPYIDEGLPQKVGTFLVGAVFPVDSDAATCKIQLSDLGEEKQSASLFMLDIDYALARPKGVPQSDAMEWIESAHASIEAVFEGCLQDDLRALFEEDV